ncbi:MAG: AzlC family ABC transporter permease [Gemmatimonadota bacterium]
MARAWAAYLAGWTELVRSGYAPPGSPAARPARAAGTASPHPPGGGPGGPQGGSIVLTRPGVLLGARLGAPFVLTSLLFGVVFGMGARQAGIATGEAVLMSAAVASGTAQLVALEMWRQPLPVAAIVLTALAVNLRFVLLGAAVGPWLAGLPRRARYGSAFLLFDENWTLAMGRLRRGERDAGVLLGSGVAMYAAWVGGTLLGSALGGRLPDPERWGLDFLVTAIFLAMLATFWEGARRSLPPWGVAAGTALLAAWLLPGGWHVLLGGLVGSVAGGLADAR